MGATGSGSGCTGGCSWGTARTAMLLLNADSVCLRCGDDPARKLFTTLFTPRALSAARLAAALVKRLGTVPPSVTIPFCELTHNSRDSICAANLSSRSTHCSISLSVMMQIPRLQLVNSKEFPRDISWSRSSYSRCSHSQPIVWGEQTSVTYGHGFCPTFPEIPLFFSSLISTRRFLARPSAVLFAAAGSNSPYPNG